jgi:hypothetical protein
MYQEISAACAIPAAEDFWEVCAARNKVPAARVSEGALPALQQYANL